MENIVGIVKDAIVKNKNVIEVKQKCIMEHMYVDRDVDNSRKPGKLPCCERDFSGCKALLLSPKCF